MIGPEPPAPDNESTVVKGLDMANDQDRGLVRTLCDDRVTNQRAKYTGMDNELREQIVKALKVAMRRALEGGDIRAITGAARTLIMIDEMTRRRERDDLKDQRLDAGLPTEVVEVQETQAQREHAILLAILGRPENAGLVDQIASAMAQFEAEERASLNGGPHG